MWPMKCTFSLVDVVNARVHMLHLNFLSRPCPLLLLLLECSFTSEWHCHCGEEADRDGSLVTFSCDWDWLCVAWAEWSWVGLWLWAWLLRWDLNSVKEAHSFPQWHIWPSGTLGTPEEIQTEQQWTDHMWIYGTVVFLVRTCWRKTHLVVCYSLCWNKTTAPDLAESLWMCRNKASRCQYMPQDSVPL